MDPLGLMRPAKIDKRGPLWRVEDLREHIAADANVGNPITRRTKTVTPDYEAAAEAMAGAKKMFMTELDALNAAQSMLASSAKAASTNIRKASNEIHEGVQRVEKAANFDRLERQVCVLERAAAALTILADLEKDGRLSRLLSAVK